MEAVINHVFLPPKLPQSEDVSSDVALLETTLDALAGLERLADARFAPDAIKNALFTIRTLKATDNASVGRTMTGLQDDQTMAIRVTAQNAAVLVSRRGHQLVFEQFEISPKNEAVYSTSGRLKRTFPSSAVAVDAPNLRQGDFTSTIVDTLCTMARQEVPEMQPESRKARVNHEEDRDTTRPAMVSELVFGMLRGMGSAYSASTISKYTREEVLWKNARRPW